MLKKVSGLLLLLFLFAISCNASQNADARMEGELGPQIAEGPAAEQPAAAMDSAVPETAIVQQQYVNDAFGLSFLVPTDWFGPEEYVSEQTLRVEVGSDPVYPYGTDPLERPEARANAYHVIVQYDKDGQYGDLTSTYQSLAAMQNGESLSDARGMIIRVRPLNFNGLTGYEYITTLSDTAQTTPMYSRTSILMDAQGNYVTVFGTPSQVELADGTSWRDSYRLIDEANLSFYQQVVESISIADD